MPELKLGLRTDQKLMPELKLGPTYEGVASVLRADLNIRPPYGR